MSSPLTPSASDALGLSFAGVDVQDPDGVSTADRVCGAATFGKPVQDEILALIARVYRGYAVQVFNDTGSTLPAGAPVQVASFDAVEALPLVTLANANAAPAHLALLAGLVDQAQGLAIAYGSVLTTLDTSGAAVGDDVFLSTSGTLTLTDPTLSNPLQLRQVLGQVHTVANPGKVYFAINHPAFIGGMNINTAGIRSANLSADAILAARVFG